MKVMISRNERGRALIKTLDGLNLQDLTGASDDQINAVTSLVWEIKGLFHALIKGKASDVLGDFNIGGGAKLSADLVADLTASIPRDVVISAQQQWLPNLATEMANHSIASDQKQSGWTTKTTESASAKSAPPAEPAVRMRVRNSRRLTHKRRAAKPASIPKRDPPPCIVRVLGQCLMFKGAGDNAEQPRLKERQKNPIPRRRSPLGRRKLPPPANCPER